MPLDISKNKKYFEDIAHKIDLMEHPEINEAVIVDETYGTVDGDSQLIPVVGEPAEQMIPKDTVPNIAEIENKLPQIDPERIDGAVALYKELNRNYGLKFDADKIATISGTFKSIIDPTKKEIFEVYLREYIDRLRLACINQLANTVYSLIMKLTSNETIQSLTISERVALLDRLFEYMDRVNNMATLLPKGDTNTELREIAERDDSGDIGTSKKPQRNRELESYVLSLLKS